MNETNELQRNITKVRVLSDIEKEETIAREETENGEGIKVKFDEACESGLIKPGMIVKFKDPTFGPIFLDKERTGYKENQNYEGKIEDGIVVKYDNRYYVITVLKSKRLLKLRGRFGYAYCLEILAEIRNRALKHYFPKTNNINTFLIAKYRDIYNSSFIYQEYFEKYHDRCFIAGIRTNERGIICIINGCQVDINADVLSSDKTAKGYVMYMAEPLDSSCYIKSLIKHTGNSCYTYECSQFPFYVEF